MRYEIILLDADETLLDFNRAEKEAVEGVLQEYGLPCPKDAWQRYHQINEALWRRYERGEIQRQQIWKIRFETLFQELGIQNAPDYLVFNQSYQTWVGKGAYPLTGAVECCKKLSDMGCRLYIVTNGSSNTQFTRIEASGLSQYILRTFVSEETGYQKPMKEYFDYVFARIPDFSKEKTLLVGDSLTSDIAGGRTAGVDTCWFSPQGGANPAPTYIIDDLAQLPGLVETGKAAN